MGDGTSTSTRFIPLTHSIHSLRYFHRAPSTSRSPSATAGGAPTKVSSRPSQISSASHLPHSSVRFNVNQTQPSSPAPPSSSTRLSTLTVLLISLNPIPPIECEHSCHHHIHLTSDQPPSQIQMVVLGLPTSQNVFAVSSIATYSLPTMKRIHFPESS